MKTEQEIITQTSTAIIYGIVSIEILLIILQLWLLTATLNAYLGGDHTIVWPGAFASLGCFILNLGLLRYVYSSQK